VAREFRNLDTEAIIAVLARHGVEFIMIGGSAALALGAPVTTGDLDLVPRKVRENLDRLADALVEMHAELDHSGDEPMRIMNLGFGGA
jgi:hypothetical protein